jgi:translation initiation factor IF-1
MPGVSARSSGKNMSRGARAKADKNNRRVEAALRDELVYVTYGKVIKSLGNKMFTVQRPDKCEHLAHIRGKMARVSLDSVVLLNERDYESRQGGARAVYDIVAVFEGKDIRKLIRTRVIPSWMARSAEEGDADDGLDDLFDHEDESESEDEEEKHDKRDKKNHRLQGKQAAEGGGDSDVDIDAI